MKNSGDHKYPAAGTCKKQRFRIFENIKQHMKYIFGILLMMIASVTLKAQHYMIEGSEVKIEKPVLFKSNTAILLPESIDALMIIKNYLDDKTYITTLRIEANVALTGDDLKDEELSEERAKAVYQKLVALGVDCRKLIVTGFGHTKPVADNRTTEGKAANTNIKFVNAALRGNLLGGMPADGGGKLVAVDCN